MAAHWRMDSNFNWIRYKNLNWQDFLPGAFFVYTSPHKVLPFEKEKSAVIFSLELYDHRFFRGCIV